MNRLPISSATPGTTLRTIPIDAFSGGSKLYDTPGVHLPHRLSAQLLPSELASFAPRLGLALGLGLGLGPSTSTLLALGLGLGLGPSTATLLGLGLGLG